jgi:2-octaprenyl-6-methoxyphenol hydroxylase
MKAVVVGGGPVGLAAALALKQRGVTEDVTVLEAASQNTESFSDRNIALSAASWRFLSDIGVSVPETARAPIRQIEITQRGSFGLLRLEARDLGVTELGAATPYPALRAALDNAAQATGIQILYGAKAAAIHHVAQRASIHLESGEQILADCVVLADGSKSNLVKEFRQIERDSGQVAVITRVECARPRAGVAFERFTAGGALALIPRADQQLTVIWARPQDEAERLLQMDADSVGREINAAFGTGLGELTIKARLTSYPLVWRYVEPRVAGAIVALGNAAQGLHPVAAQGLNLGLRDALDLADNLVHGKKTASPLPIAASLVRFARVRGVDRLMRIGFTGLLAYGFDRGGWLADIPRGAGLTALQLVPPLKREITRRLALS